MAALQKIRNRASLLIGVLGIALLAFVLGDLLGSGGTLFNKYKDRAFVVDGDVVSTGDFQNRIAQFEEYQKLVSGKSSIDEELSVQIREFVFEQMIKERILDDQAKRLGLAVSREELNDMVVGQNLSPVLTQSPLFVDPQTRQFSPQLLLQFVTFVQTDLASIPDEQKAQHQMLNAQWLMIENMMKYNRLEEKYNTLLVSAMGANDLEARANIEDSRFNSEIAYVVNRYSLMSDSAVSVTDKEIQNLYNERKNNFRIFGDQVQVSYIVKDILPSQEDFSAVEAEMKIVYEKMSTTTNPALVVADFSEEPFYDVFFSEAQLGEAEREFVRSASIGDINGPIRSGNAFRLHKLVDKTVAPDSVKLRLISVPLADVALANTIADSLMNVIKGGKDFAAVANEVNPQSNGGEVGWVTEVMLASAGEDFIRRSFGAAKGDLMKLNIRNTVQLVKVEDVTKPVSKYKVAVVQMPVIVSDKTLQNIDSELNRFVAENGTAEKFAEAAQNNGFNFMPEISLTRSSTGLPQVRGSRQVVTWAFNEEVGSVKKFDMSEQRVVALINSRNESGFATLAEVSDMLKAELIRDRKAEKMIADMKAANAGSLEAYAQIAASKVDTLKFVNFTTANLSGLGREPIFNVYSKHAEVNELKGPVKGNAGVFVLTVQDRQELPTTTDIALVRENLNRTYMYRINPSMLFAILKSKMDVEDNRAKFNF